METLCGFLFFSALCSGFGCTHPNYANPVSTSTPQTAPAPTTQENPVPAAEPPAKTCPQEWSQLQLCMQQAWQENPVANSYVALQLNFGKLNSESQALQPVALGPQLQLQAQLWMPAMGHGGPPVQVDSCGIGCFNLTKIYFIMPGTWEIRLKVIDPTRNPSPVIDQYVLTLDVGS